MTLTRGPETLPTSPALAEAASSPEVLIAEARRRHRQRLVVIGVTLAAVVALLVAGVAGAGWVNGTNGAGTSNTLSITATAPWTESFSSAPSVAALSGASCVIINYNPCEVVGALTPTEGAIYRTVGDTSPYVAQVVPKGTGPLTAVSCGPGDISVRHFESRCVAVGTSTSGAAIALTTADNGNHWTSHALPSEVSTLRAVSCLSTTQCLAVGSASTGSGLILTSKNGGASWSSASLPPAAGVLEAIACQYNGLCVTVGTSTSGTIFALRETRLTSHWTTLLLPSDSGALLAVSCDTSAYCAAAGYRDDSASGDHPLLLLTKDSGMAWHETSIPASAGRLTGVSCISPFTSDFPFPPRMHPHPETFAPCSVFGDQPAGSATRALSFASARVGVKPWRVGGLPPGTASIPFMDCAQGLGNCVGVATNSLTSSPMILSNIQPPGFAPEGPPAPITATQMASCGTPRACMVIGRIGTSLRYVALVTTNDGSSWSQRPLPLVGGFGTGAISCVTAERCLVVQHRGGHDQTLVSLLTTNGGLTWRVGILPLYNEPIHAVDCTTRTLCIALGVGYKWRSARVALSTDGGRSWQVVVDKPMTRAVTYSLNGISCPSTQRCVVAGTYVDRTHHVRRGFSLITSDGGRRWQQVLLPPGTLDNYPYGVTCSTVQRCVMFGGAAQVAISTDGGVRWSLRSLPAGVGSAYVMSCRDATHCFALGNDVSHRCQVAAHCSPGSSDGAVIASTDGGASWFVSTLPAQTWQLGDVACGGTDCYAVGTNVVSGGLVLRST
jgi:photosystem II stability/assembly factor-like uncharacterized protein